MAGGMCVVLVGIKQPQTQFADNLDTGEQLVIAQDNFTITLNFSFLMFGVREINFIFLIAVMTLHIIVLLQIIYQLIVIQVMVKLGDFAYCGTYCL